MKIVNSERSYMKVGDRQSKEADMTPLIVGVRSRVTTTAVGVLWSLLSVIVSGVCGFSFLQPFWLLNTDSMNSLGMYSYCVSDSSVKTHLVQVCGVYGGYFHFSNLPSNAWQAACVLYGGGCAFLCLAAFLAVTTLCLPAVSDKRLAVFTGYIQTMAVILMIGGLLVYPIGLDSKFVRAYCKNARKYDSGACQVGWAFMLGIMGTALSLFCPFLSQYTDMKLIDDNNKLSQKAKEAALV